MVSKLDWDLLPDEFPYEDRGCDMAPSCLSCPFPKCLEEVPWGKHKLSKRRRAERMAELRKEGKSIDEIARIFDVHERTVRRALKRTSPRSLCQMPQLTRKNATVTVHMKFRYM